ncbi:GntR family transcriptional regulator [Jiella sonneratiae]|uniref:GntR family transcriptional regulator n=1 Tax=Jiella sonneratiae TaxID=2816856 RepID=A0ABS3JA29_9HYPH|nr:GntR family transcriptional regulator [Jiella sonneratiae]MBO0906500.1 GntR family transcriptional regulator [Jiella sonneratiae]
MSKPKKGDELIEPAGNSVDLATRLVREAILNGGFGPGERLKIGELATRFGLSPMPLREALRKLEGEGLVEIEQNKGATVRRLDREYVSDLFELNTDLRIIAIRRGVRQLTLARIETLETLAEDYARAVETGDDAGALELNRRFNTCLVEFGGNREALRIFQRGWEMIGAFRRSFGYGEGRRRGLADEMKLLVGALRRHDLEYAEAILRMQNAAVMEDLMAQIDLP